MKAILIVALAVVAIASYSPEAAGQTRRKRPAAGRPARAKQGRPAAPVAPPAQAAPTTATMTAMTTASGLTYIITQRGDGRQPKAGEVVLVHYTGTLSNGVKFDSSRDRGEPISFQLGAGRVIKGWDEGIARLRVGDRAVLVVPPQLGYGSREMGNGLIPADSTLIFIVELVDVKAASLSDVLSTTLKEKGIAATVARYHELKRGGLGDIYTAESEMNEWAYRLLRGKQFKEAIEIFKLNVDAYPKSANVYDSLAEAYMLSGDRQAAIENYQKALAIDPQMESARKALNTLKGN